MSTQERHRLPAAARFSAEKYGVPTRVIDRTVNILTTRSQLWPNNPDRIFAMAMNRSVDNGAVSTDGGITFANGIKVGADGGFISMEADEDGEAVAYEMFAIQQNVTGAWRVIEVVATYDKADY